MILREHIPNPFWALPHAVKVIFSVGPMIAQPTLNGHRVVSIQIGN